jgi:hypothetical protein
MRISEAAAAGVLLAALTACNEQKADTRVLAKAEADQSAAAADDGRVKCALAGATAFERVCAVDRSREARGLVLTMRHPDGGFRRLLVANDGRGVVAADGAEAARVTIVDPTEIEVALGDDIYRLPATMKDVK